MLITCSKNCCPTITIDENSKIFIRDDYLGLCRLTQEQFTDLITNTLKANKEIRDKVLCGLNFLI